MSKVLQLSEELPLVQSILLSTTGNSSRRAEMLHRQQVERLVEGAIREVAGTERIPEGQPVSPEGTLVNFELDSLDTVEVEIAIEENSDGQIQFDDDNRILPSDSFSEIVSKAMTCQCS